jgi:hypothetical protein
MRKLTVALTILVAAVTGGALAGCGTSASTGSGSSAGAGAGAGAGAAASASAAAKAALPGGGSAAPAQWLVEATDKPTVPLAGKVTFRDASTGKSVSVAVGASGQFSLGLAAGRYTATPQAKNSSSACSAPVAVTVRAGQQTKVSLTCAVP